MDVSEGDIVDYKIDLNLDNIRKFKIKDAKPISEQRVGTFDLETYNNDSGYSQVYAAGFYSLEMADKPYITYIYIYN